MLHIQVHSLSHVSLAYIYACCSRFWQSTDYSCAPVAKETPVCLCSCTLCEGIHAQVTSQGEGGGRGVRGPGPESTYNDSAPSLQVTEAHAGGTIQKAAPAWVVYIRHASILICLVALRTAKNLSRECLAGLGLPLPQQAGALRLSRWAMRKLTRLRTQDEVTMATPGQNKHGP